jgi:hypothetical protein
LAVGDENVSPKGLTIGFWINAYMIAELLLMVVIVKMAAMTRTFVWVTFAGLILSLLLSVFFQWFLQYAYPGAPSGTFSEQHSLPLYWFMLLIFPAMALLPDFTLMT